MIYFASLLSADGKCAQNYRVELVLQRHHLRNLTLFGAMRILTGGRKRKFMRHMCVTSFVIWSTHWMVIGSGAQKAR